MYIQYHLLLIDEADLQPSNNVSVCYKQWEGGVKKKYIYMEISIVDGIFEFLDFSNFIL